MKVRGSFDTINEDYQFEVSSFVKSSIAKQYGWHYCPSQDKDSVETFTLPNISV